MSGQSTLVVVGTNKGAFAFRSDASRREWELAEPMMPGWEVSAVHLDPGGRLFLGTTHYVYGATFRVSDDFGKTFRELGGRPSYTEESGRKVKRIWQLRDAHPSQKDTLLCGIDEAGLFISRDRGETWSEVDGLTKSRKTSEWFPGNGGLCLHTILVDPHNAKNMWVGISAVGFFRSTDGGETWEDAVEGLPGFPTGEAGSPLCYCVHKVVLDPRDKTSQTLFMQFHGGVLKSTDGARSWQKIENGLPGNFGFPMTITRKGELFVIPLTQDEKRFMPDGRLRVWKSTDDGASWSPREKGLPVDPQYVGVLRDAMTVDQHEQQGVYLGTTMGEVFASNDAGESWTKLPGQLPRIECVRAYVV